MSKIWNRAITVGDYFKVCGVIMGIYMIFLGGIYLQYRKSSKELVGQFTDNSTEENNG